MKKTQCIMGICLAIILTTGVTMAKEKSTVETGQKLFNDSKLSGSTNDKSCNSCHNGGSGLEKAGGKEKLSKIINKCVTGPLGGEKIDGRSVEMRSLKMYIESLAAK